MATQEHRPTPVFGSAAAPSDTRTEVVRILSATVNGCLGELGYDPRELQALKSQNQQWQIENVKLYEDNTHLNESCKLLREQLNLLRSPAAETMLSLQNELTALRAEKDFLLNKMHAMEQQQPGKPDYTKLYEEYTNLSASHQSIRKDYTQLRLYLAPFQAYQAHCRQCPYFLQVQSARQVQHQSFSVLPASGTQQRRPSVPNSNPSSQPATPALPHLNSDTSVYRSQPQVIPSSSSAPPSNSAGHPVTALQVSSQAFNPPSESSQHQRSISVPVAPFVNPVTGGTPAIVPRLQLGPGIPFHSGYSQSNPVTPVNNIPPSVHGTFHPNSITATSTPAIQAGAALNPSGILHTSSQPSWTQPPSIPTAPDGTGLPQSWNSGNATPIQGPGSYTETKQSLPSDVASPQVPQPLVSADRAATTSAVSHAMANVSLNPSDHGSGLRSPMHGSFLRPSLSRKLSLSINKTVSATPMDGITDKDEAMASETGSMNVDSVKRPLSEAGDEDTEMKKPRLGVDDEVPPQSADPEQLIRPTQQPGMEADNAAEQPKENISGEEDEEEEEIRLGPDGLRLVSDCLDALFADEEGGRVCQLCMGRYLGHLIDVKPEPFPNPPEDELVAHCVVEHADIWNDVRNGGGLG